MIKIITKDFDNTTQFYEAMYKGVNNGLTKSAMFLRDKIKPVTPYRTGRLRRSMRYDRVSGTEVRITADPNVFESERQPYYAWYMEFGTPTIAPRAMMRRGFDENLTELYNKFKEEIYKELK